MKHAFKDHGDGYYEVDVADGEPLPEWTIRLTPCDVQAPAFTFNQAVALDRLRKVREPLLNALAGLMADAIADGDTALRDALRTARQGLKDLPADLALKAATSDKDFDYIAHERYKALAAALPAAARAAFKEALL